MKKLLWMFIITVGAAGQSLTYVPIPMGAYLGSGGSWSAWNAVLGSQSLGYAPPPIALYCSTNGTTWQPCSPSGASTPPAVITATPSAGAVTYTATAAPTIVFNEGQLAANVTSASTASFVSGTYYTFIGQQNGATRFTKVWPASFQKFPDFVNNPPELAANWYVLAYYDGTNVKAMPAGTTNGYSIVPDGTAPTANPVAAAACYTDPTSHITNCLNPGGVTTQTVRAILAAVDTSSSTTTYTAASAEFNTTIGVVTNMRVLLTPTNTNTGASTLALQVGGAIALKRFDGTALTAGELIGGSSYEFRYNGTNWIALAPHFPVTLATNFNISSDTIATCNAVGAPTYFTTTYTLPANRLSTGVQIHLRDLFQLSTTSGTVADYTFMKAGATVVAQNGYAVGGVALSNYATILDVTFTGTAAPGASVPVVVETVGMSGGTSSTGTTINLATNGTLAFAVGVAVATTVAQTCSYTHVNLKAEQIN